MATGLTTSGRSLAADVQTSILNNGVANGRAEITYSYRLKQKKQPPIDFLPDIPLKITISGQAEGGSRPLASVRIGNVGRVAPPSFNETFEVSLEPGTGLSIIVKVACASSATSNECQAVAQAGAASPPPPPVAVEGWG